MPVHSTPNAHQSGGAMKPRRATATSGTAISLSQRSALSSRSTTPTATGVVGGGPDERRTCASDERRSASVSVFMAAIPNGSTTLGDPHNSTGDREPCVSVAQRCATIDPHETALHELAYAVRRRRDPQVGNVGPRRHRGRHVPHRARQPHPRSRATSHRALAQGRHAGVRGRGGRRVGQREGRRAGADVRGGVLPGASPGSARASRRAVLPDLRRALHLSRQGLVHRARPTARRAGARHGHRSPPTRNWPTPSPASRATSPAPPSHGVVSSC